MFNRSISVKVLFLKATLYINDAIIDKQSSINQILIPYLDIIVLCLIVTIHDKSMWCGINACEVA